MLHGVQSRVHSQNSSLVPLQGHLDSNLGPHLVSRIHSSQHLLLHPDPMQTSNMSVDMVLTLSPQGFAWDKPVAVVPKCNAIFVVKKQRFQGVCVLFAEQGDDAVEPAEFAVLDNQALGAIWPDHNSGRASPTSVLPAGSTKRCSHGG